MCTEGLRVLSGSSDSSGCALGVSGFVRFGLVRPGSPWDSLGSFGFVWFVRLGPGVLCVLSGSSGSFLSALGALSLFGYVWFIRMHPTGLLLRCGQVDAGFFFVRLVRHGVPYFSLGSFRLLRFIPVGPGVTRIVSFLRVRTRGLRNLWGISGSFRNALGVAGLVLGLSGLFAPEVARFVRARLIRLAVPCVSLSSFALVWFVRVSPGGSLGSFGLLCFVWLCPGSRWVHSGSSACALGLLQVTMVRSGASLELLGSFGFVWLVLVHPWGR